MLYPVFLSRNLNNKIIPCKEKYEPRLIKFRIFSVWCGKCQALIKLLIRVFSLMTEAIAEVCPVLRAGNVAR